MARYPEGIGFVPHNSQRPFQARITFRLAGEARGRRVSLGYFASVEEAEQALQAVRAEIKDWADMQIPPPRLLPLLQAQAR